MRLPTSSQKTSWLHWSQLVFAHRNSLFAHKCAFHLIWTMLPLKLSDAESCVPWPGTKGTFVRICESRSYKGIEGVGVACRIILYRAWIDSLGFSGCPLSCWFIQLCFSLGISVSYSSSGVAKSLKNAWEVTFQQQKIL